MAGNKEDRKNIKKSFAMENYLSASSELIKYRINHFSLKIIVLGMLGNNRNKSFFYKLRQKSLLKMINSETIKPMAV